MWDNEIDLAARGMTTGEPGGDLKARVIARVEEHPRARRFGWMTVAAPAALAIAALAFWVYERPMCCSTPASPAAVQQAPATSAGQAALEKPSEEFPTGKTPNEQPRIAKAAAPRVATPIEARAAQPLAQAAPEQAVPEIEPMRVVPVTVEAVPVPEAIVVEAVQAPPPIEIDELDIPTLAQ